MVGDVSDMEEEGEGDSREDSSQTARQLVKTAMKEAERGTHSDEEDTMEFAGGEAEKNSEEGLAGAVKYGGITTLFKFGAGMLRNGPVDLTPGFSVGKLLDPVPESEQTKSVDSSVETSHVTQSDSHTTELQSDSRHPSLAADNGKQVLNLESYLKLIKEELRFSDSDVEFAKTLYNTVASSGVLGVARDSLGTHNSLCDMAHQRGIEDHVQTLLNFQMVWKA